MSNPPLSNQEKTEAYCNQGKEQATNTVWETPIIRGESGELIGISIFIAAEDLIDLDLEVETSEKVEYQIREGNRIRIGDLSEDSDEV